jgi:hypothetical protein
LPRFASEDTENILGNFLRAPRIAGFAQGGGENEINVPPDNFAKGVFTSRPGELLQPLEI